MTKPKAKAKAKTALLIIDMFNTFAFPEGPQLLRHSIPVAKKILRLKARAVQAGVPVIYANDNFGKWRSSWEDVYKACTKSGCPGKQPAEILKPGPDDLFVLKPKHSAFYATTLEPLLQDLGCRTLILTGIAGNICILFTAADAHMREYSIIVPQDCVASNTKAENTAALKQLNGALGIKTTVSSAVKF